MSYDVNEFMEDTVLPVTEQALSSVTRVAKELVEQRKVVAQKEEELKREKEKERVLEMERLPDVMDQAGISEITLITGEKVALQPFVRANISKDNERAAFDWLRDHGHGDLIKRQIVTDFGRGEDDQASEFLALLEGLGRSYKDKTGVHYQTLTAFVREQLGQGEVLPTDLFGIYQGRKAKIS